MASRSRKSNKKTKSIWALVDDGNFHGYFETEDLAFQYVTNNNLEDSVILEVVQAHSVVPPEEPELELQSINLEDLIEE